MVFSVGGGVEERDKRVMQLSLMRFPKRIAEMVFLVFMASKKINEAMSLCLDPAGNQRPQV